MKAVKIQNNGRRKSISRRPCKMCIRDRYENVHFTTWIAVNGCYENSSKKNLKTFAYSLVTLTFAAPISSFYPKLFFLRQKQIRDYQSNILTAVSYTHLDVYKRQLFYLYDVALITFLRQCQIHQLFSLF